MSSHTDMRHRSFPFFTCPCEHHLCLKRLCFSNGDSEFNGLSLCSTPVILPFYIFLLFKKVFLI